MLYITADKIGTPTGGGLVTAQECFALEEFAKYNGREVEKWSRDDLIGGSDPWGWDQVAVQRIESMLGLPYKLIHLYSGSFSQTVQKLKEKGCKVCYTCAAHRVSDSKKAHEELGIPYNYPHLTDPNLWALYSNGYWLSDCLVVPSQHSKLVVEEQMDDLKITNRPIIKVIPHGCEVPMEGIKELPSVFTVGTLGAVEGPDKGLKYLLSAWKKLSYKNAMLIIAGKNSIGDWVKHLCGVFGGGSIYLAGWQSNLADFYNSLSMYCQCSPTEGFGIEVLEAHAYGRVSLCSDHAGSVDVVHESCRFSACDVDSLADKIDEAKRTFDLQARGEIVKKEAQKYTWDKIRQRYKDVWLNLLN